MRAVVMGGTGFIGRALTASLVADGWEVVIPSRSPQKVTRLFPSGVLGVIWSPGDNEALCAMADGADALVNLVGENIASGRWTEDKKRRIMDSRLSAGKAATECVARAGKKPNVFVQASAVGLYGPLDDRPVDETEVRGSGFLAEVAARWEESTREVEDMGVRRVIVRTAMVLGPDGGALAKMLTPFRLGLGGPLGDGTQPLSWIHLDDEVRAIRFLMDNDKAQGPFNLSAPEAATSKTFAKALGRALKRPAVLPVPAFVLRLAFGQMADEILLSGQNAEPKALTEQGFHFTHPNLAEALNQILGDTTHLRS